MSSDERFYAELAPFQSFAAVVEPATYADAPRGWAVALTDVRGSTAAIQAGRYKEVNALGVAGIVAVLNAVPDLELPYVFGGDGATLLFPESRRAAVEAALRGARRVARERFDLELRVAVVPVADLVDAGHPVRVARFAASPWLHLAMLAGSGLSEAERRVKHPEEGARWAVPDDGGDAEARFDGFECRWEPIRSRNGRMVALLVQATDPTPEGRAATYREALARIAAVVGDTAAANPASPDTLWIASRPEAFDVEARLRGGRDGVPYALHRLQARALAGIGRALLATGWRLPGFDGARYREEVVANTDFRKFDETLRMVLDLDPERIAALEATLAEARRALGLAWGLHQSDAALMTCLVYAHEGRHLHFVDGADGGYAMAARPLKEQLKADRGDASGG